MQSVVPLTGRLLLAAIFLTSGLGKIFTFEATQGYMAANGMPAPAFLLVCALVLEIGGSLSLFLGYKARWGAWALFAFLVPTTIIFHTDLPDQQMNLMKNLAILGGLLMVAAFGAGASSLDALCERGRESQGESPG